MIISLAIKLNWWLSRIVMQMVLADLRKELIPLVSAEYTVDVSQGVDEGTLWVTVQGVPKVVHEAFEDALYDEIGQWRGYCVLIFTESGSKAGEVTK